MVDKPSAAALSKVSKPNVDCICVFIAEITFAKRGDAKKALDKYNGVHLDGAKMKIQFVQGQSISERVVLPQRPLQVGFNILY